MSIAQALTLAVGAALLVFVFPRSVRNPVRARAARRRRLRLTRPRPRTTPDLAAIDRLLDLAVANAEDEHLRLRPLIGDIARQRLADHTGVRIETAPEAAAALLGPETWELVRPEREMPPDRRARGIAPDRLRAVVAALERIGAPSE
ncbi:MAG TPA: hypothetical protein VGL44_11590 [Gaiellales bacterium]